MRFSTTVVLAATAVSAASITRRDTFEFPDNVPLVEKRQEPGTPRYECHANCGTALQLSRASDFSCDNSDFTRQFNACLDCALEFDIWQYYGNGLKAAATKCGLDATPKPTGSTGSSSAQSTSAAPTSAAPTSAAPTSTAASSAAQTSAASSSAASSSAAVSSSGAAPSSSAVQTGTSRSASASSGAVASSTTPGSAVSTPTSRVPTSSIAGGNSTITTGSPNTPVPTTAGAAQLFGSTGLIAGAAIFAAVNMM
ncbi:unnamed protein product [Clonostachys rhizophaga]|uniref:Uncharacterized protein n=1 Tax=Clonostachys rhizophaga TaxID=160324 RepID=A0A9N9V9U8_9HYPO|nr:unnamed protein product [Clonostachys rhizophaga]